MIKLQNLCFPDPEICSVKELYVHETEDTLLLDGFINLLYLEKRKKYTQTERLVLKLSAPGYDRLTVYCDRNIVKTIPLDPADRSEKAYPLPCEELKGRVLYLGLRKAECEKRDSGAGKSGSGTWEYPKGAVYADLPEEVLRPVNIGIDICTFRREEYVARNLKKIRQHLLDNPAEEAGQHLRVYVIDNGRTLDLSIPDPRIQIFPNKNAGGAGGFTRGMLEVLNDKEKYRLTHVLLMDDDAVVDPEAVVRTYGFLSTLKEDWKDVTVGGVLMDENHPKRLIAFGEWWERGHFQHTLGGQDVSSYSAASDRSFTAADNEFKLYSGWWFCCYSLNTVREDNLPLPLFIHNDDIEYCQRNSGQGCVFLNGVGVWHNGFDRAFDGVNSYYNTRNGLINFVCRDSGDTIPALRFALRSVVSAVLRFRMCDARLSYRGVIDFLKGPEWLYRQDPDKLNAHLRGQVLPLHPWKELEKVLSERDYRKLSAELDDFRRQEAEGEDIYGKRRCPRAWKHVFTLNGLLLKGDPDAALFFPRDSIYRLYRKKTVVLCEPGSGKAAVIRRDYKELLHAAALLFRTFIGMLELYPKAAEQWKAGYQKLITREAWNQYLNR